MAGNAIIGALRVVLGADTAALETGLKGASSSLDGFVKAAQKAAGILGATLSFAGAAAAVKGTINNLDALSKSAQKVGIPTEELAALGYAAKLADVDAETLQKGLIKLSKASLQAAQGAQEPIAAFQALKVSFRDADTGGIRPVLDISKDIAERFANMRDGTMKTALAMQVLGKSGAELIPLLNGGRDGLNEMTAEAKALGLVVSTDTGRTAEAFNDNLTRLRLTLTGMVTQFTANILPTLARFSDFLVETAKNSGFVQAASQALTTAFIGLARVAVVVYDNFGLIVKLGAVFVGAQLGAAAISFGLAFVKMAAAIRATGIVLGAFELIRGITMRGILLLAGIVALAAGAFDGFSEKIGKIGDWLKTIMPEGSGERVQQILAGLGLNLEGLTKDLTTWQGVAGKNGGNLFDPEVIKSNKNALESFLISQQKSIAATNAQAATVGMAASSQAGMKLAMEAVAIAQANGIPMTAAYSQSIADMSAKAGEAALKLQGVQLVQANLAPGVAFRQEMANNQLAMESVNATAEQLARSQEKVAEKFGMSWSAVGGNIADVAGSLSQLTGTFAKENKAMGIASKAFGISQAIINTQIAITKALATLPPPASYIAVAAAIAQGAASVATIASQKFATGGFMRVGGTGVTDSQRVSMDVTPGEIIEVHQNQYGESSSAGGRTLTVQGVDPEKWFSGRQLIEIINAAVSDGSRLKIAPA